MITATVMTCFVAGVFTSCDKELYSEQDALNAAQALAQQKLNAEKELANLNWTNEQARLLLQQKIDEEQAVLEFLRGVQVDVTILIKDVTDPGSDMSGFTVSSNQFVGDSKATTDKEGFATIKVKSGEALVLVTKAGYARTLAYIAPGGNQAYIIPVYQNTKGEGKITGTLYGATDLTKKEMVPVPGVTLELSINTANLGAGSGTGTWSPGSDFNPIAPIGIVYEDLLTPAVTDADGQFSFDVPKTKNAVSYSIAVAGQQQVSVTGYSALPPNGTDEIDLVTTKAWTTSLLNANMVQFGRFGTAASVFAALNITIDAPEAGDEDFFYVEQGEVEIKLQSLNIESTSTWNGILKLSQSDASSYTSYRPTEPNLYVVTQLPDNDLNFVVKQTKDPTPVKMIHRGSNQEIYGLDVYKVSTEFEVTSRTGVNLGTTTAGAIYYTWAEAAYFGLTNKDGELVSQNAQINATFNTAGAVTVTVPAAGRGYSALPNIFFAFAVDTVTTSLPNQGFQSLPNYSRNIVFVPFSIPASAGSVGIIPSSVNNSKGLRLVDDGGTAAASLTFNIPANQMPNIGKAEFNWGTHSGRVRLLSYPANGFASFVGAGTAARAYCQTYVVKYHATQQGHYPPDAKNDPALRRHDMNSGYLWVDISGAPTEMVSDVPDPFPYVINYPGEYKSPPTLQYFVQRQGLITSGYYDYQIVGYHLEDDWQDEGDYENFCVVCDGTDDDWQWVPDMVNYPYQVPDWGYVWIPAVYGTIGNFLIAEVQLEIDEDGAITGDFVEDTFTVLDPTNWNGPIICALYHPSFTLSDDVRPAFARATVNTTTGEVTSIVHYNNTGNATASWAWGGTVSGLGYTSVPEIEVEAVGDDFEGELPEFKASIDANGSVTLTTVTKGTGLTGNFTPSGLPVPGSPVTSVSTNGSDDVAAIKFTLTNFFIQGLEQ